jgi:hypothetical protein
MFPWAKFRQAKGGVKVRIPGHVNNDSGGM